MPTELEDLKRENAELRNIYIAVDDALDGLDGEGTTEDRIRSLRTRFDSLHTRLSGLTCFVPPEFHQELNQVRESLLYERNRREQVEAELEELEKQEPVAYSWIDDSTGDAMVIGANLYNPEPHKNVYALFARPAPAIPEGWIPVEEKLPKGGQPVLILSGGKVLRAAYAAKFELDTENWGPFNDDGGDYNEADDRTYWPEGWYEWNQYEEIHWAVEQEPTHWMPLPAAPKQEEVK